MVAGIVRRIDDLGRVVIPKEIRRVLHINEGDPLEMHVEGNKVCMFRPTVTKI
jgi:AbrB family looped-hinge helix DNA binding protein